MKTDFYEIKKVINGIKVHLHVSTHKICYHFFQDQFSLFANDGNKSLNYFAESKMSH